jgi:elongator complex protein 6
LAAKKRFAFVDGLSGLFLPKQQRPLPAKVGEKILSKPDLTGIAEEVQQLVRSLKDGQGEGQVLLIIDQIDLLLAAGGDHITAVALGEMLMGLREVRGVLSHSEQS